MGVVLGSAVVPIALAISWRKANKWGSIAGAVIGFCCGLIAWLVTTSTKNGGIINVTVCFSSASIFSLRLRIFQTTGGDNEMLAGNLASIGVGGIVTCVFSYFVRSFRPDISELTSHVWMLVVAGGFQFRHHPSHQRSSRASIPLAFTQRW